MTRTGPIVVAHRGNSMRAPENTLASMREAFELGADVVELDLRLTQDGVPVLLHDATVDRTTNGTGPVSAMTLADVKELDAGSWKDQRYAGELVPTLTEALEFGRGRGLLLIDAPRTDAIPAMVQAIDAAAMKDGVLICGCYVDTAPDVHRCDSELQVCLNVDAEVEKLAQREDKSDFNRAYIRQASRTQLGPLIVWHGYVTGELMQLAHRRGMAVWPWTIDDEPNMRRFIELGADAIVTNDPERLIRILT